MKWPEVGSLCWVTVDITLRAKFVYFDPEGTFILSLGSQTSWRINYFQGWIFLQAKFCNFQTLCLSVVSTSAFTYVSCLLFSVNLSIIFLAQWYPMNSHLSRWNSGQISKSEGISKPSPADSYHLITQIPWSHQAGVGGERCSSFQVSGFEAYWYMLYLSFIVKIIYEIHWVEYCFYENNFLVPNNLNSFCSFQIEHYLDLALC